MNSTKEMLCYDSTQNLYSGVVLHSGGDFFWLVGGRGAEPPAGSRGQSPWSGGAAV